MQKLLITVPDEMYEAIQRIATEEDKVLAAIIRRAIAEHLASRYNIEVDHVVQRGGNRRSKPDDES